MGQYEQIAEKIKGADGILIGASNGLSIAEGYNIFVNDAFYITFNKGELYIPQQIEKKSMGVDGDLSLILPEILAKIN